MQFSRVQHHPHLYDKKLFNRQEIYYTPCPCNHCLNDTKPLPLPSFKRIVSSKQTNLSNNQAYIFLLQNLVNFKGIIIPDTLLATTSQIYYSNEGGRVRCKQKQTNLDFIKLYDEKKKKTNAKLLLSLSISTNFGLKNQKNLERQIAIIYYKDGHSQLVSENTLYQILNKRKSDPLWVQILSISLLQAQKKYPLTFEKYSYKATYEERQQFEKRLERLAEEIDIQDQKNNIKLQTISKDISRNNTNQSKSVVMLDPTLNLRSYTQQVVAYLEIVNHIKVLQCNFYYIIDFEDRLSLIKIQNFIFQRLDKKQLKIVHDRYQTLNQIGNQQLNTIKINLDDQENDMLWNICVTTLADCLQRRQIELKIQNYSKPSFENLKAIFMKMIPQFNPTAIFENPNWRNQLGIFLKQSRRQIDLMIRQDEGIRILKRFGIVFFRTFS